MYVYIKKDVHEAYTVGHYNPQGEFIPTCKRKSEEDAATIVNYLNGGIHTEELYEILEIFDKGVQFIKAVVDSGVIGKGDESLYLEKTIESDEEVPERIKTIVKKEFETKKAKKKR